jgi:ABC-2 type transport system permease protein
MKKYWQIFRTTVDEYFVYRLNFTLWRFRVVLNLLMIYFLWTAIYLKNREILGYSKTMMLTYVLLMSMLSDFVFSSRIHELGGQILQGDIINILLKPVSFLKYLISKEAADKAVNISFAVIEVTLLVLIFRPNLTVPPGTIEIFFLLIHLVIGLILSFFISFSVSMIAFWSAEIWAPRFVYFILVFTLAGNYFPLDILPKAIYNFLLFTPFPYFIFVPAQIYLKGLTDYNFWQLGISLIWVFAAYTFARFLWNKGIKEYSFYGR